MALRARPGSAAVRLCRYNGRFPYVINSARGISGSWMAASAGPGAPVRQVEVLDIEREHPAELAALFQQAGQPGGSIPVAGPGVARRSGVRPGGGRGRCRDWV